MDVIDCKNCGNEMEPCEPWEHKGKTMVFTCDEDCQTFAYPETDGDKNYFGYWDKWNGFHDEDYDWSADAMIRFNHKHWVSDNPEERSEENYENRAEEADEFFG